MKIQLQKTSKGIPILDETVKIPDFQVLTWTKSSFIEPVRSKTKVREDIPKRLAILIFGKLELEV
jgi:hypothetical protein